MFTSGVLQQPLNEVAQRENTSMSFGDQASSIMRSTDCIERCPRHDARESAFYWMSHTAVKI